MVELVANLMEGSSHGDVVLAAKTESQQKLLTAAGLAFRIVPPEVDEAAIYEALYSGNAETDPSDVAELLARAKAEEVSARVPAALVIGADQVLSLDGKSGRQGLVIAGRSPVAALRLTHAEVEAMKKRT